MKKILLFSAIVIASCTKVKYTVLPIHDTTIVQSFDTTVLNTSIVGKWTNNITTNIKPVFTNDSEYWDNISSKYAISADTIFYVYSQKLYPEYIYSFSKNNDTLHLTDIAFPAHTLTYWRIN